MVGVPRSRGCAACRKQKKKCYGSEPPCARCKRLSIPCVGLGQQRFKFQDESQKLATIFRSATASVPRLVSNDLTKLTSAFIAGISPAMDIRIQLLWNFGWFLEDIPCRLGTNESLDAAVEALLIMHMAFQSPQKQSPQLCLSKYCRALKMLRYCLEDPVQAQSSETLCSTMLLFIYEALAGSPEQSFLNHAGGAAHIIKARGQTMPKNEFERKLFLSLRCPVIMQALFDPLVQLSDEEWNSLVNDSTEDSTSPNVIESDSLKCMARVPNLLRRTRAALSAPFRDITLINGLQQQTRELHDASKWSTIVLCERLDSINKGFVSPEAMPLQAALLHAFYARSAAQGLATDILINCLLLALEGNNPELQYETAQLSLRICNLASEVSCRRPLGTLYMLFVLRMAFVGADDPETKDFIEALLMEFKADVSGAGARVDRRELEGLTKYFRIQDVTPRLLQ